MSKNQAATTPPTAGALEEAELCNDVSDYYGAGARVVMGIVLRSYLDSRVLTPFEILHSHKLLKTLTEQGQLVENAVVRVAAVQSRGERRDPKARRAAIHEAIAAVVTRARTAQVAFAGLSRDRGALDGLLALPDGGTPTGDTVFDLRVAVALDLSEQRGWAGKLDRLIELMSWDDGGAVMGALDGALADVLGAGPALHELFGNQNLPAGAVMVQLCTLVLGRTASVSPNGPNRLSVLNGLFRMGKLPESRAAVLERLRRQLRSPQPLGRGQRGEEVELLKELVGFLITPDGVIGDAGMAEALTIRYSRRLEQGGASAFRHSIVGVSEMQADLFCRIRYLSAVSRTAPGQRHLDEIADALDGALGNEPVVETALTRTSDLDRLRGLISEAAVAVHGSALPAAVRSRIAGRVATLFDGFAMQGRLFHRLRQLEPLGRRRVLRLAEIACSGLLSDHGGLPAVRRHIMEVVRQPQFEEDLRLAARSDMAQAEARRLFELLERLRQMPDAPPPVVEPAPRSGPATAPTVAVAPTAIVSASEAPTQAAMTMVQAAPAAPQAIATSDQCPNCFADGKGAGPCGACGYPARSENRAGVHLLPGTRLHDRYAVGRLIGQGGFGATYLGWDERLHVKVAAKEYFPANLISRVPGGMRVAPFSDVHGEAFEAGRGKFLEEARMLARLRAVKEIVLVQDFFEENGTAYLIMELLQGRTLKRYIAESGGSLEARRTLAILTPMMKALQSVHDHGLIHRDVSPDNIFITAGGDRKLLDFGAARHALDSGIPMTVILKPGYAPPEQYSPDAHQGPWTDVYAMCATAYCALTGRSPPDATARFLNDTVPKPSDLGAAVPAAFERVLLAGLAMRPGDRPQSMLELMKEMAAAFGG